MFPRSGRSMLDWCFFLYVYVTRGGRGYSSSTLTRLLWRGWWFVYERMPPLGFVVSAVRTFPPVPSSEVAWLARSESVERCIMSAPPISPASSLHHGELDGRSFRCEKTGADLTYYCTRNYSKSNRYITSVFLFCILFDSRAGRGLQEIQLMLYNATVGLYVQCYKHSIFQLERHLLFVRSGWQITFLCLWSRSPFPHFLIQELGC